MEEEMETQQEEISDEDALKKIAEAMVGNAQTPEDKLNVFTFLNNVATALDTTKVGFLRDDAGLNEVGIPKLPVRSFHSLALISREIMGNDFFAKYFEKEAEIVTKTSLSREGFLTKLAVVTRREVADVTRKPVKENKGWFKPKQPATPLNQQPLQ